MNIQEYAILAILNYGVGTNDEKVGIHKHNPLICILYYLIVSYYSPASA
jgi:hypothetical protein